MSMTPEIRDQVQKLLSGPDTKGQHVQTWHAIKNVLTAHQLVYSMTIKPQWVHVHHDNRDGVGVCAREVHELLNDVVMAGWSSAEPRAVCIEVPGSDAKVESFNQKLFEESKGLLAPILPGTVKYASVSSSHCNQMLRLFAAECEHKGNEIITVDDKLSMEKLRHRDPAFAEAVATGLTWQVVSSEVVQAFPQLPNLIQQAENTGSQLQRQESEMQLMRRIYMMCIQNKTATDFEQVKSRILRTRPACATSLPAIFKFLASFGSIRDGRWLDVLEMQCRSIAPRCLGPDFWEAVATPLKGRDQHAGLRMACISLAYTGPEKYCNPGDVRKLFTNQMLQKRQSCTFTLELMRKLCTINGYHEKPEFLEFEKAVASIMIGKVHPDVTHAKTIEEAAAITVNEIHDVHGSKLTSQFDQHLKCAVTPSDSKAPVADGGTVIMKYDDHGCVENVEAILKAHGFVVGSHVIRKDKVMGEIKGFEGEMVLMATKKVHFSSFTNGDWNTYKPIKDTEHVFDIRGLSPLDNWDNKMNCLKAMILVEMREKFLKSKYLDLLVMHMKPKAVHIGDKPVKHLELFPFSSTVICKKVGETPYQNVIVGEFLEGYQFSLPPLTCSTENQSAVPFWYVSLTENESEANLELHNWAKGTKCDEPLNLRGVCIPSMRSKRTLQPGEELIVRRPPKKAKQATFMEPMVPTKRLRTKA